MKLCNSRMLSMAFAATLTAGALTGCSGDNNSTPAAAASPSGKVVQGPVSAAFVFADSLTTGTRYVKDPNEIATFTLSDGSFKLPSTPTYTYVIVSQKGTDTLTGRQAIQLIAPAGARNVSALTTLVALAPDPAAMKTKLELLGIKYDDDISKTVTTAALMLAKSVENTIDSMSNALNKGGRLPSGVFIDIQNRAAMAIAAQLATVPNANVADLYTPTALKLSLTTAVTTAVTSIQTGYGTMFSGTTPATVAANAVKSVDDVVTTIGLSNINTTGATAEGTVITTAKADILANAIQAAITTATSKAAVVVTAYATAPTVTTNFDGISTDVNRDTTFKAHFSQPIDLSTIAANITLTAGGAAVSGAFAIDEVNFIVTFTPSAQLAASTSYTFKVNTDLKNVSGVALATAKTVTVTTIAVSTTGSTGSMGSTNF